jgi:glycosyltransferase involved in cell wall biosynthesis
MKILIISSYLPYPLFSGGHVRLYNLMRELSQKHEITLICEKRPFQKSEDIDEVKKICKEVITVDRGKQWSPTNVLKAGFSTNSFLLTGHTSLTLQKKIQEALDQNTFDVIHVETYYVMQNVPKTDVPIVLVEHNIEYQVYEKFMEREPLLLRPVLQIDINKIKKEEEKFWKKANSLVAVSREDQDVMTKAGLKPQLVSNGVNTHSFTYLQKSSDKTSTKKLLFIGDFKWIQNQDTIKFIIHDIWPKIKELRTQNQEVAEIKLWIVGRKIPNEMRGLTKDQDVVFDEASSSLSTEKIFHQATLLLAPIRVGGGTSYKILESMSSGTPVVTMKMSADAIDAKDGMDIMVGKDADELAKKSITLLTDENVYKTISKNGRILIEKNYTWEEIGKKLEEVYQKAACEVKV